MFIVAVTGGIATGKSTITNVFREAGIPVVDADLIARQVVECGRPAWKKIREEFGDEVLNNDKSINREVLGQLVFNDVEKRKFLNSVTHPDIHSTIYREVVRHLAKCHNFIVVELPLLFETGIMLPYIHKIITVTCEEDLQLTRLMNRNGFKESDAKKRISAQMPLNEKCKQSDFVIDNSGDLSASEIQAEKILRLLRESKQHWKIRGIILATAVLFFSAVAWLLEYNYNIFTK